MTPRLKVVSLSELAEMEFPQVEYIVEDVVASGSLSLLVGRHKVGKSLFTLDMGVSTAAGETFAGKATMQGAVLYVPAEDNLRDVKTRVSTRIGKDRDVPFYIVPVDGSLGQGLRLDDPASFAQLAAILKEYEPVLVILDPLREMHRLKENDADQMSALLRPLRQLAHESNAAIVLNHHRNKYGGDDVSARGSSAIPAGVDIVMTVTASTEDSASSDSDHTLTITVTGRYGPKRTFAARLGDGLRWEATRPTTDEPTARQRVITILESCDGRFAADDLAHELDLPKKTIQNALTALVRDGRIVRSGQGRKGEPFRYELAVRQNRMKDQDAHWDECAASTSQKLRFVPTNETVDQSRSGRISTNGHTTSQGFCRKCGNLLPSAFHRDLGQCPACLETSMRIEN